MTRQFLLIMCLVLLNPAYASAPAMAGNDSDITSWNFNVYLDGKQIGTHRFTVTHSGAETQVQSDASFKYKFLFITVYRYEHKATEHWSGDCLTRVDATTNANGKRTDVSGERTDSGFLVKTGDKSTQLPKCVMTFAYWNPDILDQPRLLNPQTGEFLDVSIMKTGTQTLDIHGEPITATRFALSAKGVELTLWYSPEHKWLALESLLHGKHVIRYELS